MTNGPIKHRPYSPKLAQIERAVTTHYGVTADELRSKSRHSRITRARRAFVAVARATTSHSYPDIAYHLGRVNHSCAKTWHTDATRVWDDDEGLRIGVGAVTTLVTRENLEAAHA